MVDSDQLKVDVEALWDHGARHLPEFAEHYGQAAQEIFDSTGNSAYMRSGVVPPAFNRWIEYRDFLQSNILQETATNLLEVGKALERYAIEIAEQDGDSSKLLEFAQEFDSDVTEEELKENAEKDAPPPPDDVTEKDTPGGETDPPQSTDESREQKQQDQMGPQ